MAHLTEMELPRLKAKVKALSEEVQELKTDISQVRSVIELCLFIITSNKRVQSDSEIRRDVVISLQLCLWYQIPKKFNSNSYNYNAPAQRAIDHYFADTEAATFRGRPRTSLPSTLCSDLRRIGRTLRQPADIEALRALSREQWRQMERDTSA